jgi:flagellar biosynthetic protein FliP
MNSRLGRLQMAKLVGAGAGLLLAAPAAAAEDASSGDILRAVTGMDSQSVAMPLRLLAIITVLGVVPSIVLLTTSFPRILIVLSFLRRALGTQDLPPNQVVTGLSLLLTVLVMLPVWQEIYTQAYLPLQKGELKQTEQALERAGLTLKRFMLAHTLENDLRLFEEMAEEGRRGARGDGEATAAAVETPSPGRAAESSSFFTVLPAFVISELKLAFQMGFLLYLPFLVIDLAISAMLISMGMFMLPPVLVSLPLKVLVFVLADGWNLIAGQLMQGFRGLS